MNLSTLAKIKLLTRLHYVDANNDEEKGVVALEALEEVRVGLLAEQSTPALAFKCFFQFAHKLFTPRLLVLFKTLVLHTVEFDVTEHRLREGFHDVDTFQLKVEVRNEHKEDADKRRLSSCRESLVEMNSTSLTVAADDPASLGSFEKAVVVEPVREDQFDLADESVLGTLDKVKGVDGYYLNSLTQSAPHSC
eukprot:6187823-Pleurochrysis_carterae.AAC.6